MQRPRFSLTRIRRSPSPSPLHTQHTAPVTSLLLLDAASSLVTASRDATLRRWSLPPPPQRALAPLPPPTPTTLYTGHADWVTCVTATGGGLLASGSHDGTVRLWRAGSDDDDDDDAAPSTRPLTTLVGHTDYVTCVAAPVDAPGVVISAGLGGVVRAWDVSHPPSSGLSCAATTPTPLPAARASVYALAVDATGSTILAGCADGEVRVTDARAACGFSLVGHTDVIRTASLSPDGMRALTGSSDRTLRLWDVRSRRCVWVLAPHTASVWAAGVADPPPPRGRLTPRLAPATPSTSDWGAHVVSAGRDGCVYRTHAPTRTAELVASSLLGSASPFTALALDPARAAVWTATGRDGSITAWPLTPSPAPPPPSPRGGGVASPRACVGSPPPAPTGGVPPPPGVAFHVPSSPLVRAKQAFPTAFSNGNAGRDRAPTSPLTTVPAPHPLVQAAWLPDRRHFVARAVDDSVALWDVARGAMIKTLPPATTLSPALRSLWRPDAGVAWAALDTVLGAPRITLGGSGGVTFGAEWYASSLRPSAAASIADDLKVNVAVEVARACLASSWGSGLPASALAIDPSVCLSSSTDTHGTPWAAPPASLVPGTDTDLVPAWVAAAASSGPPAGAADTKLAFILKPDACAPLPPVHPPRLSAPRVLALAKVAAHAASALAAAGVAAAVLPAAWSETEEAASRSRFFASAAAAGPDAPPPLELLMGGAAVPHDITLAGAKAWLWPRVAGGGGGDPVFTYRLLAPGAAPAPRWEVAPPADV